MAPVRIIRITSLEHVDQMAKLTAKVWMDDAGFAYMHPRRHEFPDEHLEFLKHVFITSYVGAGRVILAACVTEPGEPLNIVGLAVWQRFGSSDTAKSWQGQSRSRRVLHYKQFLQLFWRWVRKGPIRSVDLPRVREILSKNEEVRRKYHPDERWRLDLLGVLPDWSRRGIGSSLVQWGIDRCDEEGVTGVLEASAAGQGLYQRLGFEHRGWMKYGEGGTQKSAVMIREPDVGGRLACCIHFHGPR